MIWYDHMINLHHHLRILGLHFLDQSVQSDDIRVLHPQDDSGVSYKFAVKSWTSSSIFFFESSNIKFSMFRCTLWMFKQIQIFSYLNSQCSDVEFWMFRCSACQPLGRRPPRLASGSGEERTVSRLLSWTLLSTSSTSSPIYHRNYHSINVDLSVYRQLTKRTLTILTV